MDLRHEDDLQCERWQFRIFVIVHIETEIELEIRKTNNLMIRLYEKVGNLCQALVLFSELANGNMN